MNDGHCCIACVELCGPGSLPGAGQVRPHAIKGWKPHRLCHDSATFDFFLKAIMSGCMRLQLFMITRMTGAGAGVGKGS